MSAGTSTCDLCGYKIKGASAGTRIDMGKCLFAMLDARMLKPSFCVCGTSS